jgi:hypothetical protein
MKPPCRLVLCLALFLPFVCRAAPVTWSVRGQFADGGSLSGTFVYDAATNLYSNVNVTTTAGSVRGGSTYQFVCGQDVPTCTGVAPSANGVLNLTSAAGNQAGLPGLALFFTPSLASLGAVGLSSQEATCANATCNNPAAPARFLLPNAQAVALIDFQIRYTSNLADGDSFINITNTGSNGAPLLGPGFGGAAGNICVNVYAFSPDEQLISCCSCLITPNGLVTLSANSDLVSKTLTGVIPTSIVVKLLATGAGAGFTGSNCAGSAALAGNAAFPLVQGMQGWGTTLHTGPPVGVSETPFSRSLLSAGELASITGRCAGIIGNGSGFGICRGCRLGALGAPTHQ